MFNRLTMAALCVGLFASAAHASTITTYTFTAEVDPTSLTGDPIGNGLNYRVDTIVDDLVNLGTLSGTVTFSTEITNFQTPSAESVFYRRAQFDFNEFDIDEIERTPAFTGLANDRGTVGFDAILGVLFPSNAQGRIDAMTFALRDDDGTVISDARQFPALISLDEYEIAFLEFSTTEIQGQTSSGNEGARFNITSFTPVPAPVPLPAGLPLLLVGCGAFAALRRRR
ncbi:VPLPA-CTERM sorting domain-containing protein [Gymnodinialimonas sp. 2305UL16-5]|uniref:VPLPA-CTERM sorting domain-containing protein n=1 Tax=Gymnodinialimonas mytili TaxID=3126503 RepID=UPI0030AC3D53